MNRRRFLLTLGTAVAANAAGSLRPLRAAEKAGRTPLTVTELGERLFVVCGGGGNVTVFHPTRACCLWTAARRSDRPVIRHGSLVQEVAILRGFFGWNAAMPHAYDHLRSPALNHTRDAGRARACEACGSSAGEVSDQNLPHGFFMNRLSLRAHFRTQPRIP